MILVRRLVTCNEDAPTISDDGGARAAGDSDRSGAGVSRRECKARNTSLEGDTFEFITGYDTIMSMGAAIKKPMTPELKAELQKLAVANGAMPTCP